MRVEKCGEISRYFFTRISEHRDASPRTKLLYATTGKSNIYRHFLGSGRETSSFHHVAKRNVLKHDVNEHISFTVFIFIFFGLPPPL